MLIQPSQLGFAVSISSPENRGCYLQLVPLKIAQDSSFLPMPQWGSQNLPVKLVLTITGSEVWVQALHQIGLVAGGRKAHLLAFGPQLQVCRKERKIWSKLKAKNELDSHRIGASRFFQTDDPWWINNKRKECSAALLPHRILTSSTFISSSVGSPWGSWPSCIRHCMGTWRRMFELEVTEGYGS